MMAFIGPHFPPSLPVFQPNFLTVYGLPTAPPPWYHPRTMNPNLNTIPAADLPKLKYTIWQPLTNDWSPPITFEEAQEFAARDPELHACAILPSGEYTDPAPFAETYKRANVPRDLETATALRQRANRVHAQRTAARLPDTTATRASKLIILYILGTLYITGGAAILYGLLGRFRTATEAIAYIIVGVAVTTAAIAAQRYTKKK